MAGFELVFCVVLEPSRSVHIFYEATGKHPLPTMPVRYRDYSSICNLLGEVSSDAKHKKSLQ